MENINKLLDAAKHAKGVTSDYALAKALELPTQRVSDYYKGSRVPDEFACLQIAKALGRPLDSVIATVKAATEKDEKRREVWENYMKSIGGIAAAVFITISRIVTGIMTSNPAEAAPVQASEPYALYYVKSKLRLCAEIAARLVCKICTFSPFSTRVRQMTA